MAEGLGTLKKSVRKPKQDVLASKSLLQCGTPVGNVNANRLSLMTNARLQKITSTSLERLSIVSEKEDSDDLEGYFMDYGNYLLRKAQSCLLARNRQQKEESVKMCFVSLKLEYEELLEKFIQLSKETQYITIFLKVMRECRQKIEDGEKILKALKDCEYEDVMTSLSQFVDLTINKLHLIDIDKSSIEELFSKNIWGTGSELEESLKKINAVISKNQDEVSKIAAELVEIKRLSVENELLRERFSTVFKEISDDYLEKNYKLFTGIVKTAFNKRQECMDSYTSLSLDCDLSPFLQSLKKSTNEQPTLQFSNLDSSYPLEPNSASTPQQKSS